MRGNRKPKFSNAWVWVGIGLQVSQGIGFSGIAVATGGPLGDADPNRIDTRNLAFDTHVHAEDPVSIQNFCSYFILPKCQGSGTPNNFTSGSNPNCETTEINVRGLAGVNHDGAWGNSDHQWCANHGYSTSSVYPLPSPSTISTPTTSCPYPLRPEDNNDCDRVRQNLIRCQFHGRAVEHHCLAYYAADEGTAWMKALLALDFTAATTCTLACATGNAFVTFCEIVGGIASVTESIATFTMKNGEIGQMIDGIAAAGAAASVGTGAIQHAMGRGTRGKNAACFSAAFFVVLGVLRTANVVSALNTKSDSAREIENFIRAALGTGPDGRPTNGPGGTRTALSPPGGTGGTGGSDRGSGRSPSNVADTQRRLETAIACVQSGMGNSSECARLASTQEAQALNNDGGRQLAPLAAKINPDELLSKIKSNGFGGALEAAMGGQAGEVGAGLAQLAQYAQDHAAELGGASSSGSSYTSGGGGGGGKGSDSGAGGLAGLGSLFGGGGNAPMGGGTGVTQFAGTPKDTDIWHANTTMNLFEIVSGKINQVTHRVK